MPRGIKKGSHTSVNYKYNEDHRLQIVEDSITKEVFVSFVAKLSDTPHVTPIIHKTELFKVKKENVENFKKALLKGGTFECTINIAKNYQAFENKTLTVVHSQYHAYIDLPNMLSSYAIELTELKKFFILN